MSYAPVVVLTVFPSPCLLNHVTDQLLSGLRPSSLLRRTECSLPLSPVDGFQITKSLNFGKHRQAPTRVGALTQGSKKTTRRAIVSVCEDGGI